jgi:hypothetical protein
MQNKIAHKPRCQTPRQREKSGPESAKNAKKSQYPLLQSKVAAPSVALNAMNFWPLKKISQGVQTQSGKPMFGGADIENSDAGRRLAQWSNRVTGASGHRVIGSSEETCSLRFVAPIPPFLPNPRQYWRNLTGGMREELEFLPTMASVCD